MSRLTSVFGLIRDGWQLLGRNFWPLLRAGAAAYFPPPLALRVAGRAAGVVLSRCPPGLEDPVAVGIVMTVAYWVLCSALQAGFTGVVLAAAGGLPVRARDVFAEWRLGWRFFLATVLCFVLSSVGLLLLVIPGIYIVYRLRLYPFFLVDRHCGTMESLRLSWAATKGYVLRMLALDLAGFAVVLLGFVCLVVAVIPAALVFYLT